MGGNKSIKKNYFFNLFYQIFTIITPLIVTPYISRILGPDGIGEVSYAESIVSYFVLFATMGIATYGQREISYVQDSLSKRSLTFWNIKCLQCITSSIVLTVYIVLGLAQTGSVIYFILALHIVAVLMDVTWFFQGMEEFVKLSVRSGIFKIINIIYVFLMVKTKEHVHYYAFGLAFFTLLGNLSLWVYMPQYVQKPSLRELHPFRNFKEVFSLFVPTIAIQVYTVLDKTMIGMITQSSFENGYYEQALKISRLVLTLVTALGTVMIPRIGYHFEKKQHEEVRRLMYRGYNFVWFLGFPLCFGLLATASSFVPWFFGAGFEKVTTLISILAFLILAIGVNNVTGMQYLIPTKRQSTFAFTVVVGASINLLLNLLLIKRFQSAGAAFASVLAETGIAVIQLYIIRKELSITRIVQGCLPYLTSASIMFLVLEIFEKQLKPIIPHTIILVVCGCTIYIGILLLMKDPFLLKNISSILVKVNKKKMGHKNDD